MRPNLRSLLTLLLVPITAAAATHPPNAAPPTGALVLTALTPSLSVCLGERATVDVFVSDAVYGMPPGGAVVTLSSSLGAADSVWTPGGAARLAYQPRREGADTLQITATSPMSATGIVVPAQVERCRWTWDLFYSGSYPHPKGFWVFMEEATVAQGTLQTEGDGSRLTGSGTIEYSISAHGAVPQAECDFGTLQGSTTVQVTGTVGEPAPGSMMLNFSFEPAPVRGSARFDCRFVGQQLTLVTPVLDSRASLSALPLSPAIVPTDFGMISRTVPAGVFWLITGNGRLTLVVTRVSG